MPADMLHGVELVLIVIALFSKPLLGPLTSHSYDSSRAIQHQL